MKTTEPSYVTLDALDQVLTAAAAAGAIDAEAVCIIYRNCTCRATGAMATARRVNQLREQCFRLLKLYAADTRAALVARLKAMAEDYQAEIRNNANIHDAGVSAARLKYRQIIEDIAEKQRQLRADLKAMAEDSPEYEATRQRIRALEQEILAAKTRRETNVLSQHDNLCRWNESHHDRYRSERDRVYASLTGLAGAVRMTLEAIHNADAAGLEQILAELQAGTTPARPEGGAS